ncbi:MAG: hypothetical protein JSW46_04200 [Gemmatimonadota bacterium]|nr:MAG: hypothetical protein JSW46_04200 [Gemmatimonadota bacterium]
MTKMKKTGVLATLLLLGAAACADLDVVNPNDPERERALSTASDIESLIAGSMKQWSDGAHWYEGSSFFLSSASFQSSAPWNNAGMVPYSWIPRPEIQNNTADTDYQNVSWWWYQYYKAIAQVWAGLRAFEDTAVTNELGRDTLTAMAFGKFVQGLAHGSLALQYDQGFIVDETVELFDEAGNPIEQTLVPYGDMMTAALGYFDQAIALAEQGAFTVPSSWMSVSVSSDLLVQIAHSMKARYRAAVARNPTERDAVRWDLVIADVNEGVTEDWIFGWAPWDFDAFSNDLHNYYRYAGWQQLTYFILGMADQSGNYQTWLSLPLLDRVPAVSTGGPIDVLIITPDLRFPQGATVDEQRDDCPLEVGYCESKGKLYAVPHHALANQWQKPERQRWRWSYYWSVVPYNIRWVDDGLAPEITMAEMDLLVAEGLYRQGDLAGAANIINQTRVPAGLNATDATGLNTSCVPKLPDESCGDLFEMLKWEKRLLTQFMGLHSIPWYYDGRGWGDLYVGTWEQFPVPCGEMEVLRAQSTTPELLDCYTFGSPGGASASPGSIYNWPGEL